MEGEGFIVDRRGDTAFVELDRPEKLNALDWDMRFGLERLWADLAQDTSLRCVVITGRGRGFCAGADVGDLAAERGARGPTVREELAFVPGWQVDVPVIVGVNGVCAGGGLHFVADADVVVASRSATFLDPHVDLGQVSGVEPAALALRMPLGTLNRLVLLGRAGRLDAEGALAAGLVGEVVDDERLMARLSELATAVESASPTAVARSRRLIRGLEERLVLGAMQEGWEAVQEHWRHPDSAEGPRAFAEGRPPAWKEKER